MSENGSNDSKIASVSADVGTDTPDMRKLIALEAERLLPHVIAASAEKYWDGHTAESLVHNAFELARALLKKQAEYGLQKMIQRAAPGLGVPLDSLPPDVQRMLKR